jgi:hypothetical protein
MLMRGNTPPTTRSPPHRSRPTGNPPNRQPATVSEEELGGRDPTSRQTLMRVAPYCRQPQTARHTSQPRSSNSHPPQQQDTVHRELRPGTGKGASAGAGPSRPRPRPPRRRSPTRHVPRQQQQAGGNEDILSSSNGPSTARCSKDVTTHQHRPGARPGRPCPVPARSGQPLPCERRFSSALGDRVFSTGVLIRGTT